MVQDATGAGTAEKSNPPEGVIDSVTTTTADDSREQACSGTRWIISRYGPVPPD